jgi:hypothetical protein
LSFDLYLWASASSTWPDARVTYEALALGRLKLPPSQAVRAAKIDVQRRLDGPIEVHSCQGHVAVSVAADHAEVVIKIMREIAVQHNLVLFDPYWTTIGTSAVE